ncbi:PhzF family phenazine biosynthesis protein [Roseicyclus mahoneyensis]|uniref:Trans-2,3-dihydro-3-hydroxyanthranilate isomerase n=1 Tax=Roseicyclus mahoneyensis TaxID=164332 RepID=A0A316GKG3_9RHOB|nr:PhzF family phenazine biosynthesis protein [Roseicyclus mahoneyensis]PWK61045.1 trans-2,3-dihydro-3-hydroxyanthranilate isomerase [Roseicyclus mahoneyensis]
MLRFHIYDVFTTTPFTGNPLAIVEGADDLTTAQMQTIARQFNLSETIFVQRPSDPAHSARVRIFFPTAEIPFAGHPTIGCALHLAGEIETRITLEEEAGLVPVTITRDGTTSRAEFTAPKRPVRHAPVPPQAMIAAALGLQPARIGPHGPSVWQGGPAFLYFPVTDLSTLAAARPHEPAWSDLMTAAKVDSAYLYTATPEGYRARMFSPGAGIPEDPATGSASAILAAQLLANGALPEGTTTIPLQQGIEMGRPSVLRLTTDVTDGALGAIRVAGSAVRIAEGSIRIP